MKINRFMYMVMAAVVAMTALLVSCEESEQADTTSSDSVILSCEEGASGELSFTVHSSWVASNANAWFGVVPGSGSAGENTLTVIAKSENSDLRERVNTFTVHYDTYRREFYVIQRGVVATLLSEEPVYAMAGAEEVAVPVSGTFPFEDIEVSTDAAWLGFSDIRSDSEPEVLADGLTLSAYREGEIILTITEDNDGATSREARVTVKAGDEAFSFTVVQQSTQPAVADFGKEFYKVSAMIKFTGTWCTNCPNMSETIHLAQAERPERLYLVNVHNNSSNNLDWPESDKLINHFNVSALPSGFFNGYAEILNRPYNVAKSSLVALIDEAVADYPTDVAICASSRVKEGKINLSVDIASKVSADYYRLTVFFLEDGIKAEQSDGSGILPDPENYIHKDILRGTATNGYANGGDRIVLSQGQITREEFSVDIPSGIVDIDNAKVLVYVTHPGGPTVEGIKSQDIAYNDFGWVLDNAVMLPVNGFVDFRYE